MKKQENSLGVGRSTVCMFVYKVYKAITETLLDQYVSFPTVYKLKDVIQGSERAWKFLNCGGGWVIDGCHILMKHRNIDMATS